MDTPTLWWILAGMLVAAELSTGSVYLLMLALGAAAGALAAHFGVGLSLQVVAAALTGGLSTAGWYLKRRSRAEAPDVQANRNVNLDIGETVQVTDWDAQGHTKVQYRGASWAARWAGQGIPQPGPHRIAALRGNQLELETL